MPKHVCILGEAGTFLMNFKRRLFLEEKELASQSSGSYKAKHICYAVLDIYACFNMIIYVHCIGL